MKRPRLIAAAILAAAVAVAVALYVRSENEPIEKRGSPKEEFVTTAEPPRKPPPKEDPEPWATYGFDRQRTHVSPYRHRPPYRRLWKIDGHDTLEFPPSVGYGRVYLAQQKGLFFALDAETGRVRWRKDTKRCMASSPTLANGVVYQSVMHRVECLQDQAGANGFLIAWDAKTGRKLWKFKSGPIESSPLYRRGTLYVGTWGHRVYAIDAKRGHKRWSFETDDQVNTSAAYWRNTIYIASDGGTLYALNARNGRLRWKAEGPGEFYYATPTVAYGRVFLGNTDGTMYVYGAKTGRLLWARPLGTYVYSAAAVWKRTVYVGTYDGSMYALDAATGDVKWKVSAPGAVHAAPTVMRGIVYYSTCSTCGSAAQRAVKHGPDGTFGLDARTGRQVWRFEGGKYANPVVADRERVYVTGRAHLFGMERREPKRERRARRQRRARR